MKKIIERPGKTKQELLESLSKLKKNSNMKLPEMMSRLQKSLTAIESAEKKDL